MTRYTINVKLLVRAGAALVVLAVLTHFLHGWQMRRHARGQLVRAEQAQGEGHPDEALAALERYFVFAPDDYDRRARYAVLRADRVRTDRERWRALEVLRQVLARDAGRCDARRKAYELAFALEQFGEARTHLEALLRAEPERSDLLLELARCASAEGDHEEAARALRETVRLAPAHFEAHALLADVLRQRLGQAHRADKLMADLVEAHPGSARVALLRARYREQHNAFAEAGEDLARARTLAPHDLGVLSASARLAHRLGRLEEARTYWAEAVRRHPREPAPAVALAALDRERGHLTEAVAALRASLRAMPDHPDLLFALTDAQAEQDRAAAEATLARFKKAGGPAPARRFLTGRIEAKQGKWAEAARAFEEASRAPEASPALRARCFLELAHCRGELGQFGARLLALRQAVAADPGSRPAQLKLGEVLLKDGPMEDAGRHLEALMKSPAPPEAGWALLAEARVRAQFALPVAERDWLPAESALERAETARGPEATALLRAEMLEARDRGEEARTILEKAIEKSPRQLALWTGLAGLLARGGDLAGAEKALNDARGKVGDGAAWRMARVNLAAQEEPAHAWRALRDLEKGTQLFSGPERERLLWHLARTQQRLGDQVAVARLARQLVALLPEAPAPRLLHVEALLALREDAAARVALAGLRGVEGENGALWRCGAAARLLSRAEQGDRGGLEEARRLTAEVRARRPNWSRGPLLEARLADLEGKPERALPLYLETVRLGDFDGPVVRRTVRLLLASSRPQEADRLLERAQQHGALSRDSLRLAAEVALLARRHDRAVDLARAAVHPLGRSARDRIWLAGAMSAAGRPTEGESLLRQAVELSGGSMDAWLALLTHLNRNEQPRQLEAALVAMERELPPARLPLARARACEALGRFAQATRHYSDAIAKAPDDPVVLRRAASFYLRSDQPARAEAALGALLGPRAHLAAEELPQVRRDLALASSADGARGKREVALKLLAHNRRRGEAPADRRVRALVEASSPSARLAALQALEGMAAFSSPERSRLAQLYEAEKDWARAGEHLLRLVEGDENNPVYLARLVQALTRQGKKAEARSWLARLEKMAR